MKALVLEGGGAKGAYEAGAIAALNNKKIYFDAVGGTSIGAINAAFYATKNFSGLYKLWMNTDSKELFEIDSKLILDIVNDNFNKDVLKSSAQTFMKIVKSKGIETKNIRKILDKNIKEYKLRKSKIDFGICTYNISDKKPVYIYKKDIEEGKLTETILASAYLPFFKMEKIINNKYYIDGGVHSNCPVELFINKGYDEIYAIKNWQKTKIKYANNKNVKMHIITPREDLGSIVLFEKETSEYRFNLGYFDTLKYIDNLDGDKYYFKHYSNEYYDSLFDKKIYKLIIKKYNNNRIPNDNKKFIIKTLEKIMSDNETKRFKIYNPPYLITRLKYIISTKRNNKYYDFIKNIKVDFE